MKPCVSIRFSWTCLFVWHITVYFVWIWETEWTLSLWHFIPFLYCALFALVTLLQHICYLLPKTNFRVDFRHLTKKPFGFWINSCSTLLEDRKYCNCYNAVADLLHGHGASPSLTCSTSAPSSCLHLTRHSSKFRIRGNSLSCKESLSSSTNTLTSSYRTLL